MNIHRKTTKENAQQRAQDMLYNHLKKHRSEDVLLLLSGGSALSLLSVPPEDIDYTRISIGLVDERWYAEDKNRNDTAIKSTDFVRTATAACAQILTINHDIEDYHTAARQYESDLHTWHTQHPEGVVIAILGIGTDGHTAGIMPFPEGEAQFSTLFESTQWVAEYDATGKNQFTDRITLTCTYLREHVDSALVYVAGKEKKHAIESIMKENGTLAQTPSRIIREMKNVHVFTDNL